MCNFLRLGHNCLLACEYYFLFKQNAYTLSLKFATSVNCLTIPYNSVLITFCLSKMLTLEVSINLCFENDILLCILCLKEIQCCISVARLFIIFNTYCELYLYSYLRGTKIWWAQRTFT